MFITFHAKWSSCLVASKTQRIFFLEILLKDVDADRIDEYTAIVIAFKLDERVGGKFKRNKMEYGRNKFKEMLSDHFSICAPKTGQEARQKLIKILKDPDVALNRLADDLAKLGDTPTPPKGTSYLFPVQSEAAALNQVVNNYNIGDISGGNVVFGNNNQSTLTYEDKGTYYYLEKNHPEFHDAFIKNLPETEKFRLEKIHREFDKKKVLNTWNWLHSRKHFPKTLSVLCVQRKKKTLRNATSSGKN